MASPTGQERVSFPHLDNTKSTQGKLYQMVSPFSLLVQRKSSKTQNFSGEKNSNFEKAVTVKWYAALHEQNKKA